MTATVLQFPDKHLALKADDMLQEAMRVYEGLYYLFIAGVELQIAILNAVCQRDLAATARTPVRSVSG